MSDKPAFDKDGALTRVDNDVELFRELVELLFSEYGENLRKIQDAIANAASDELRAQAHSIKSALGNVGAMQAHAAAYELEKAGKGKTLDCAPKLLQELETAVAAFKSEYDTDPTFQ